MYRHTLDTHDSRREVLSPSWGAIIVTGLAALVVPLTITVVFSYPSFGVGILVGVMLPFIVRNVRSLGARLSRYDPRAVLRAFRPERMRVKLTERSHTDR